MRTDGSVFERECNKWNVVGWKIVNGFAWDAALLSKAVIVMYCKEKWEERDTTDWSYPTQWLDNFFTVLSCFLSEWSNRLGSSDISSQEDPITPCWISSDISPKFFETERPKNASSSCSLSERWAIEKQSTYQLVGGLKTQNRAPLFHQISTRNV